MKGIIDIKIVRKLLGQNLFLVSGCLLACTPVAWYFSEPATPFIVTSLLSAFSGFIMQYKQPKSSFNISKKEAYLTVTASWALISFFGSLPYMISHSIPSFINAIFESVSGFTTTGSSILTDIESLPKSILFWRSLTHWIGGIGIIVLVIIIMPSLRIGGYNLFSVESSLQDKIKPRIKSVGIRLLLIYLLLTMSEILILQLEGMNLFESVCHSFGTVATGGFSPKNTSISGYSNAIQYTIMIFMLFAGINFIMFYYLLKREFRKLKNNSEFKLYLSLIVIIGLTVSSFLYFSTDKSLETTFREGYFNVISIVTCTGFASSDYMFWPGITKLLLFLAMFLGGSTGSTAGGIKIARYVVIIENIKKIFRQFISPNSIFRIQLNGNVINTEQSNSFLSFVTMYFIVFLIGSLLLICLNIDMETAFSSVATCLAGIGPGFGEVGPMNNFSHLSTLVKIILTLIMLIGRLEIYSVIILFSPSYWRI